ncbi:MAG: hypothetical protein ABEJ27_07175 [Halodesulfurarchaeum sp.]
MQEDQLDLADRIAMSLGGGLILLGVVGLGIIEILTGPPFGAVPTESAGAPSVPPDLRAWLVVLGVLVFGLYAIYRVIPRSDDQTVSESTDTTP